MHTLFNATLDDLSTLTLNSILLPGTTNITVEGALSAEMHGVLHEPLQGEKRYRPGLLAVALRACG